MSGLDGVVLLVALCVGACWLGLAAILVGSRLIYDVRLGSLRTEPEAWPMRAGEALPKRALPATATAELGVIAAPARTPLRPSAPILPQRRPVAPPAPTPVPAPALEPVPTVAPPTRIRPPSREPARVAASSDASTNVAA